MKTMLHDRPLFFIFVSFALGIFFSRSIYTGNIFEILFCILLFGFTSYLCLRFKHFVRFLTITLCVCIGILTSLFSYFNFNGKEFEGTYIISGKVCCVTTYETSMSVILTDTYINEKSLNESIYVYIDDTTIYEIGDEIYFKTEINNVNLYTLGKFNSYYYKNNIKYQCSVSNEDIYFVSGGNLTLAERVRQNIKKILYKNMDSETAGVCYASLFGDKTNIPENVRESFSISSLAHLLAVSGLHVGFLVGIISLILKKFKIKKYFKLITLGALLLFYCYLCSFSPSVVRASIMSLILCLGVILGRQYDTLSSISLAGTIILIFAPLYVYDAGFLLSFACVFCMLLFYNKFNRFLTGLHIPKFLASALAMSIPIQLGLMPLLANSYSQISLLGLVAGVIAIPFFEIVFTVLITSAVICLILPFMSFILKLPMILVYGLIIYAGFISNIHFAIINLTVLTSVFLVGLYICFYLSSKIVNISVKSKIALILSIIFICSSLSLVSLSRVPTLDGRVAVLSKNDKLAYCFELNGHSFVYAENNFKIKEHCKNYLDYSRLYYVDFLITSTNLQDEQFNNVIDYTNDASIDQFNNTNEIKITKVSLGTNDAGLLFESRDICIFIAFNVENYYGLCLDFYYEYPNIDIIFGNHYYLEQYKEMFNCIFVEDGANVTKNNEIIYKNTGNWTFWFNDGKIQNIKGVD